MAIFYTDTGSITNLTVTSLTATGSLLGTASFATTAQTLLGSVTTASTASFVTASGVFGPYGANSVVSASFAVSASWAPGGGGGTTFSAGNVNNRIITATGTTPELNGEVNLLFDGTTLNVTGSVVASVDMQTDLISPVGGNPGIDMLSSFLYSGYLTTSLDWNNRELRDSFSTMSLDWSNRTLTDGAGVLAVNWNVPFIGQERMLFDDIGTDSVGWNARKLIDNIANPSIDWGNPSSGTSRNLIDSDGITTILNWDTSAAGGAWFSGSVAGTASFADRATTASFAVSASWAPGSGGVTINNNTDNYLVTATGTAATLNGEANATFNGSTLAVTGNVTANSFTGSLQGTATTASFVAGANVSGNITGNAANITAYTINQNLSTTSQVTFAGITSSLLGTATTASYVDASNVYGPYGANSVVSASFAVSASWAPGGGGVTINNNTDNYLVTATGTTATLNGEANLTFDGSTLAVTGNVTATSFTGSLQGTASYADFAPENSATSGVGTTPTATQTDTITHDLGRTPIKIRIYGASQFTSNASATPTPFSIGTWTSSGNRCIYQPIGGTITTGTSAATSTTFAITVYSAAGAFLTGVIQNVTDTTFDIAWTETGNTAAEVYLWECE